MWVEEKNIRHRAEAEIVHAALAGDLSSAGKMLQYLSSENPSLRRIMLDTLHDLRSEDLWNYLLRCLALQRWNDHVDCERRAAPDASRRIGQSIVEAFLEDADAGEKAAKLAVLGASLENTNPDIRYTAAALLGLRGDAQALPYLGEMIEGGDLIWQLRAVRALAAIKDERCGPLLIKALEMGPNELHCEARWALGCLGALANPAWVKALGHPDEHIRWHAAKNLGQCSDLPTIHLLAQCLYDESHAVRWAAARVLSRFDSAAVPAILYALCHHKLNEPFR